MATLPIDLILGLLENVQQQGSSWMALCPAHDDRNRSLSVAEGDDGQVLMYCFAGCPFDKVMAALGLDVRAAFPDGGGQMTEQVRLAILERQMQKVIRRQEEQEERLSALERLRKSGVHLAYHENLTSDRRVLWYDEGIYDGAIDKFALGYTDHCPTCPECASLTIPVMGYEGELENIRHRLLREGGDKYRPQMAGLGSQLFNAPVLHGSHERVVILEGEKKTVVFDQAGYTAVGLMGKMASWTPAWFDWFADVGQVIVALDPDAQDRAQRLGQVFVRHGFSDVRVARFPLKPDDLIVRTGAGQREVESILSLARPVK